MSAPTESRIYRILGYGIETKGLQVPKRNIVSRKYKLEFAERKQAPRLQDFDGAIVFQGTFESFERISTGYSSYWKHTWDRDELDKRVKEVVALIKNGGFVCMLLTDPFIDFEDHRDFRETDLSKRMLLGLHRNDLGTRVPTLASKVNELGKFFTLYGAAWSSWFPRYGDNSTKTLASVDGTPVSIVLDGCEFVIPTLIPERTDEAVEEYFTTLTDGIVSLWERLKDELPGWAADYRFPGEAALLETKAKLCKEISQIDQRLTTFERLKRVLVLQGEPLVDAVMQVFDTMLPLKCRREEAFREDLVLVDSIGNAVALAEVKGVSRGAAREHVNQADSHRERNGRSPEFPSLLIINTNLKNSTTLAEKDQSIAAEQIQHAARNNVLILRTLDLLNLASLHSNAKLTSEVVVELLTKSSGWLRVGETAELLSA